MRAWLIVNPSSGSVPGDHGMAAVAAEAGIAIVATTVFPDAPLPTPDALSAAGAELLILFAGDGTINAAASGLDGWAGPVLILPGGTMNMLARDLHGAASPAEILAAAGTGAGTRPLPPRIPLPFVAAGEHRAYVALIAGPPSVWARAREAIRKGRLSAAWRATRLAWARSFAGGVRLRGARRDRRHRAVTIMPRPGGLEVAAIDIDGWLQAARLGIEWLGGDWRASPHIGLSHRDQAVLEGGRSIHLLFDGEAVKLPAPVRVTHGMTRLTFIRTLPPAADAEEGA
ncbi:MAG: diacylglycerol kinase family protein [Pseudomonadota bacterium]